MAKNKKIEEKKAAWEAETLKKVLDRFPERKEAFNSSSWLPVERVYLPSSLSEDEYIENVGLP